MQPWCWERSVGGVAAVRGSVELRVEHDDFSDSWRASAKLPQHGHWTPIDAYDAMQLACEEAEKAVPGLLLAEYWANVAELKLHGLEIPDGD